MAALDGDDGATRRRRRQPLHHASAMREHAQDIAEGGRERNEFANRMVHLKDPLEWAQVQSEYTMSKQARTFAEGNRKLSEALMREAGEVMDEARRANSRKTAE